VQCTLLAVSIEDLNQRFNAHLNRVPWSWWFVEMVGLLALVWAAVNLLLIATGVQPWWGGSVLIFGAALGVAAWKRYQQQKGQIR
jgi:hypothetical protein